MMRNVLSLVGLIVTGSVSAQQAADRVAPEAAGVGAFQEVSPEVTAALEAKEAGVPVVATEWMVAAANPLAVKAGADVLAKGGTAADALVAVQVMLGLVEPQSSGLGGGAFLVWYDAATGKVTTLDGRETAPLAATPRRFQDETGAPLKFFDAVVGGRSVGVPGTPALLDLVHQRWGKIAFEELTAPAIALAEQGFEVSPRLAGLIDRDQERLGKFQSTADYFMPGGTALKAGDVLKNPAYGATLRALNEDAGSFYTGANAEAIVSTVNGAMDGAGMLSTVDLSIYQVKERTAVCAPYRGHDVCGMGPPSSGAVAVGQILGLLEGFDLSAGPQDVNVRRLMGDAARLAFADRGRYLADSDFVPVPVQGLLESSYLNERAKLLTGETALPEVSPGTPKFDHALLWADDASIELPSTSHISIVDAAVMWPA
jgi:gamma-glutamyltranspeptidase/glutathione hydrolase